MIENLLETAHREIRLVVRIELRWVFPTQQLFAVITNLELYLKISVQYYRDSTAISSDFRSQYDEFGCDFLRSYTRVPEMRLSRHGLKTYQGAHTLPIRDR